MWSSEGEVPRRGTGAAVTGSPASSVGVAATLACLLEASAEKVGNVTPSRGFADACFDDFVMGALALGPAIAWAEPGRVGWAVWKAVTATRRATAANTNLGIALLCAPIAAAWRARAGGTLRRRLARVLRGLTVPDARWAYRAIRLANPGGLGRAAEGDVSRRPTITLRQAMALAAARDSIASEYVHDFAITFGITLPALGRALRQGLRMREAIAQAHLELLARVPDTLIARKAGRRVAEVVSAKARAVVAAGGMHTGRGRAAARRLDRHLRRQGNRLNPGTSADLVAAALFAGLLEGDGELLR